MYTKMVEKIKQYGMADEVKKVAVSMNIDPKKAVEEVMEIYNDPVLGGLAERERTINAVRIYKARLVRRLMSGSVPYAVHVLDKTGIMEFTDKASGAKRKMARIYGIAKPLVSIDAPVQNITKFAQIALFDAKAEEVNKIKVKQSYKAKFTGQLKNSIYILYSAEDTVFEPATDFNIDIMDATKIADATYRRVNIVDLPSEEQGGVVSVRGTLVASSTGTSNSGRNWGRIVMIDDSVSFDAIKNGGEGCLTVFLDASQATRYLSGSEVIVVGTVAKREDGSPILNGMFIVPVMVIEAHHPAEGATQPQQADTKPQNPKTTTPTAGAIDEFFDDSAF